MTAKIKTDGIIFDMDGTIWDNTGAFAASWNRACHDLGYDTAFTSETLKKEFGQTMEKIADDIIPDPVPEKRYRALHLCEEYEMVDLVKNGEDTTYPGLEETLLKLAENIPLYVVSNCQSGYIETYFELSGHGKYFKKILCYGDNKLPKAGNIKKIMEEEGLKHPVYVGDIQSDKNSCDEAGCDFIWASYGYGKSVDSYVAKIGDIKELADICEPV